MSRSFDLSLYLVVGRPALNGRSLADVVRQAVAGGVTLVQLRDPDAPARDLMTDALSLKELLGPLGIPLIVNDRVDVALAAGADGVHLGQGDLTASAARSIAPDLIIGLSVGSSEEFAASGPHLPSVDYLGVGPVRLTSTKSDAGAAIGIEGISRIRALTDLPIVAIGGLGLGSVGPAVAAGANGVAVVSAICGAPDPARAAHALAEETAR